MRISIQGSFKRKGSRVCGLELSVGLASDRVAHFLWSRSQEAINALLSVEELCGMKLDNLTAACLLLLTITLTSFLDHALAQPGWLSIDCGASSPYTDDKGISWVPDDRYIKGGVKATVALNPANTITSAALTTLRYFPDANRTRYCYEVPTTRGQLYLVRWMAYHGNYDTNPRVTFMLSFDLFLNATITFTPSLVFAGEGVFLARSDTIHFCMFRTSPTSHPFLSSLEFRPLENSMYASMVREETCLLYLQRANCGPVLNSILRYPEDPFDRFWIGYSEPSLTTISAASVVDSGFALDKPPPAVMNTALNSSVGTSIKLEFEPVVTTGPFLVNVYLAELQTILAGQTRVFDIHLNDELVAPNVNVYTKAQNELYKPIEYTMNTSTLTSLKTMRLNLTATATSTLGPIVNAVEVYSVHTIAAKTLAADESAVDSVKKALGLAETWTGDPCVFVPYDWLSCNTTSSTTRVTAVRLSSYNLTGSIPATLRDLTAITVLALDNNKLTGAIPEWLASLPNLRELYLQNNDFTGSVPKALLSNTLLKLQVEGNPRLCSNATSCPTNGKSSSSVGIIVGVVVGVLAAVAVAVGAALYCLKKKKKASKDTPEKKLEGTASRRTRYTLAQVKAATNNNERLLGKGGFGSVYYGKLANGQEVAVKIAQQKSGQGSKAFVNEIELLTRIHHKNLVSLVGYCDEDDSLILLYEYMPLGTIQEHLYGRGNNARASFLDWPTRLQIALQAAQGLEYLHVGCNPIIIHRDVKSSNILLGEKLEAKVADFGVSRATQHDATQVLSVVGTPGYYDPEFISNRKLTDKVDVYAFGMVLLELICAQPPFVKNRPENLRQLHNWVRYQLRAGDVSRIVDPALEGGYNVECMWRVVQLALQSVVPRGADRPKMSAVVNKLREAVQMELEATTNQEYVFQVAPPYHP